MPPKIPVEDLAEVSVEDIFEVSSGFKKTIRDAVSYHELIKDLVKKYISKGIELVANCPDADFTNYRGSIVDVLREGNYKLIGDGKYWTIKKACKHAKLYASQIAECKRKKCSDQQYFIGIIDKNKKPYPLCKREMTKGLENKN